MDLISVTVQFLCNDAEVLTATWVMDVDDAHKKGQLE